MKNIGFVHFLKKFGFYISFMRARMMGYEISRTNFSCIFNSQPILKVVRVLLTKISEFQKWSLKGQFFQSWNHNEGYWFEKRTCIFKKGGLQGYWEFFHKTSFLSFLRPEVSKKHFFFESDFSKIYFFHFQNFSFSIFWIFT